ncbi:hypothetical protein HD554DRAFT_2176797 [Boletus coccyginus]|nr:hypothetical protein HD554DRAFT_2176797 [Boletus coccyginus]
MAKAPSTRSSARTRTSNHLPAIPETSDVQDNGADICATPDQPSRRRSKRTNAGTGGHLKQLEKVGRAMEASPLPRMHVDLPNNEPVNIMAPTPHRPRKKKLPAKADLKSKIPSATPGLASERRNAVVEPAPVAVQSEQGSRFGFQLRAPAPPTFVGTETLDAFELRHTNSRNSAKASSTLTTESHPHGERGTSAAISALDQRPAPDLQHNSKHASGKRRTITSRESSPHRASSPLSSPHEAEREMEPQAQNSFPQSDSSRDGFGPEEESRSDSSEAEPEEELPRGPRRHIDKGKGTLLPKSDDIDDGTDQYHDDDGGDHHSNKDVDIGQYYDDEDGGTRQHDSDDNNGLYDVDDRTDVRAKNANETIDALQRSSLPPQMSNPQEKARLPIQPFGTQIRLLSLDTQIRPLSSGSRQASTRPLEVQAPHGQKQTTASSNQWSDSQKRAGPAPRTSRLLSELPEGRRRPQALPTPPISRTNSGTPTSEREEYSHHVGDERVGVKYDLLKRHHTTNRRCRSPSLQHLESARNGEEYQPSKRRRKTADINEDTEGGNGTKEEGEDGQHDEGGEEGEEGEDAANPNGKKKSGRYSIHPKGSVAAKDTTISFYPELWRKLLDLAKARMRLHVAVEDAFPKLEKARDRECKEVLTEVIAHFEANEWEVERGIYPRYKIAMSRLIFNDTQTFRSDIKKAVMKYICPGYDLFPPSTAKTDDERLTAVMKKADDLLRTSSYLRGVLDEQGKTSNFAHKVLMDTVLDCFYSSSSKSLRQFPEFQDAVPPKALLLVAGTVHATLCLFRTSGFIDEKTDKLNSENVQTAYNELTVQMAAVLKDPYHGEKLRSMLSDWAQSGMMGYVKKRKPAANTRNEFAVILD